MLREKLHHETDLFKYEIMLKSNLPECELLADRGYISAGQQLALFQQAEVKMITPLKANMKIQNLWNYQRRKHVKLSKLFSLNFATNNCSNETTRKLAMDYLPESFPK